MTEQYQHRARKRFGQNFLHDAGVIDRILRSIHAKPARPLLEIGPGQGALTEGLLNSGAQLDVVELDKDLIPILNQQVRRQEQLQPAPGRRAEVRLQQPERRAAACEWLATCRTTSPRR
jgi:16S rRNA (adenine1518-N6/adenine1519-N6)-dimethyltransferase